MGENRIPSERRGSAERRGFSSTCESHPFYILIACNMRTDRPFDFPPVSRVRCFGDTLYARAHVRARVLPSHMHTHTRSRVGERVHRAYRRDCKDRSVSLTLSPPAARSSLSLSLCLFLSSPFSLSLPLPASPSLALARYLCAFRWEKAAQLGRDAR